MVSLGFTMLVVVFIFKQLKALKIELSFPNNIYICLSKDECAPKEICNIWGI